jgi:hypothetical protein
LSGERVIFELVRYSSDDMPTELIEGAPEVVRILSEAGAPAFFFSRDYMADPKLEMLEYKNFGKIVKLGTMHGGGWIAVEVSSGRVVGINHHLNAPLFINSSIPQFTQTVQAAMDRFPYYDEDAEPEECLEAGRDLLDLIASIDAEAAVPNRYWSTFVDDVQMGNYDTQGILEFYFPSG